MIKDVLLVEAIDLNLPAKDKQDCFRLMAQKLYDNNKITNVEAFIRALNNREKEGVTGMGEGLAIPHGLDGCVVTPTILFCRLKNPIKYESMDDSDVQKVFMIAVPKESGQEHLKLIAMLARKMLHKEFVTGLDDLQAKEDILKLL
ncbi:MAG: fructose PTS transporter subunit IIA [Longicatena sp.]